MKLRHVPLLLLFIIGLSSCVTQDYMGRTYTPTNTVTVYYSEADVDRPFEVIGHNVVTAPVGYSSDRIREKIEEKAREAGADAVIVDNMYYQFSGTTTTTAGSPNSGIATVSTDNDKILETRFIKFK